MDKPTTKFEHVDIETLLRLNQPGASTLIRRGLKYAVWITIAALVAFGAYYWFAGSTPKTTYVTEPATRSDITTIVTATGTVEPTRQVDVSSELSGIIRRVLVDYNSTVKTGDVLAELDNEKLKATVDNSRAKLVVARAQVDQAKVTVEEVRLVYERKKKLLTTRVGSQQEYETASAIYDRARANLAAAEADVGAAAAQLALDETNLRKTKILSPINGVVLSRNIDPGQTVASSFQAPVLFAIAEDLREMEVQIDVDEADVGMVRAGQQATFTVDAYSDRKFRATIRELRYGSETVQGVITYKAVLDTENPDLLLRPGMTATAEITVNELKDALSVPNTALRFSPPVQEAEDSGSFLSKLLPRMPRFRAASPNISDRGRHAVWILRDGVPTAVPVATGATDGQRTAILEGDITAGQGVIVDTVSARR